MNRPSEDALSQFSQATGRQAVPSEYEAIIRAWESKSYADFATWAAALPAPVGAKLSGGIASAATVQTPDSGEESSPSSSRVVLLVVVALVVVGGLVWYLRRRSRAT